MAALFLPLLLLAHAVTTAHCLEIHFYRESCPTAEIIAKQVLQKHLQQDPTIAAGLLRLFFHDCFIQGCDASILIDSTDNFIAEKEAPPNLTLRGFDVIDDIKAAVEQACSGVVSCADILALATRDGVALTGGAAYAIPTGRRDGTVSRMQDVHIPSPAFSVEQGLAAFQSVGLDAVDLTTLLGAHSVGFCHCGFFMDRLYNFQGTGLPDPQLNPNLLITLRQQCPPHDVEITNITQDSKVFMDQATTAPFLLDNSFYRGVFNLTAVLHLDQGLAFSSLTNTLAARYLREPNFFRKQFSQSMIKLGSVGVLTGQQGEIRLNCRKVNNDTSGSSQNKF